MAEATATTLVTLKGLNQVYNSIQTDRQGDLTNIQDRFDFVQNEIDEINKGYSIKGTKTWYGIMHLESAESREAWIVEDDPDPNHPALPDDVHPGDNIVCKVAFNSPIDPDDWQTYWVNFGGANSIASDTVAGIMMTNSTLAEGTGDLNVGIKVNPDTSKGYVTIPGATTSRSGVVTTGAQTFAGAKTFNADASFGSNVSVTGNTTIGGNTTISGGASVTGTSYVGGDATFNRNVTFNDSSILGTVNSFEMRSLIIGDTTITSDGGVLTFSM